ncbi:MAG: peptide chain release factor N(5)-glutamine methyltransferase [Treponema sp.]|nr:peptide chain release factor N(5)-glutamine methyltransferase [Treponema sp.]MBO4534140.1 peptide chain release factor N(5)-glutamine methyltransferase [Treponema sp.]
MEKYTLRTFRAFATKELESVSPTPDLDVQVLLQHAMHYDKTQLLLFADNHIPDDKLEWLYNAIAKRHSGFPVAYITGHKEFYGYDFYVTPQVLIPKPDTEILVERALEIILEKMEDSSNSEPLTICDMCTGSGCIGISVLKTLYAVDKIPVEKLPQITMVDISESALEIARKNVATLLPEKDLVEKFTFVQSDLFENVSGQFDLILSNPPYVPSSMVDELLKDGRNEPRLALDGDTDETDDGTSLIKKLIIQSCEHLAFNATILMETGEYNALQTAEFGQSQGFTTQIHTDLEGEYRNVELSK